MDRSCHTCWNGVELEVVTPLEGGEIVVLRMGRLVARLYEEEFCPFQCSDCPFLTLAFGRETEPERPQ